MAISKHPRRRLAVVTCMDCRIDPLQATGLALGDAHVIRNAGAIVSDDVRRSLALSQRALGTTDVWVVAHTDCGVLGLDDGAFLDAVEADAGVRPDWSPGGFDSLEGSVRSGIATIASDPALASDAVRGFVLDVEAGTLAEVEPG
ncbi:MAG TPA: carbonic anhydrase [Solirubrobacterales bacterium]|nr:carbonic anhydrase [Solirubrobacterales bacterium]